MVDISQPSFFVLKLPTRQSQGKYKWESLPPVEALATLPGSESPRTPGGYYPTLPPNHHEGEDDGCRSRFDYPKQTQAGKLDGCEEVDPAQRHMSQQQEIWLVFCWHQ